MKRNLKIAGLALLGAVAFASCSTDFLEEKTNYDMASPVVYDDYAGAVGRVNDCYSFCLPNVNGTPGWQYTSTGKSDDWSKCTEEYSGFGVFVNPQNELNTLTGQGQQPDYFQGGDAANIQNNVWGLIRNVNDAIIGIEGSKLSKAEKDELTGQLYVLRAWRYFLLWKWYGGVPIIKDLPPITAESVTPRSSAREVFEFIIADLDKGADLLQEATGAGQWKSGSNYGRITTGTALAIKTRVLAWWCSPLFNRSGDVARYEEAYQTITKDLERIHACGYGQYRSDGVGNSIKDWANMFSIVGAGRNANEEIFFARFNNLASGTPDYSRNNSWEHAIRPANTLGGGGITPSAMIVDLFPMADGKRPATYNSYTAMEASSMAYDPQHPFIGRDLRFYRTFGFPGLAWDMSGNPTDTKNMNPYASGYILWNYLWYIDAAKVEDPLSSDCYGADNLLKNVKGMYVTKRSTGDQHKYVFKGTADGGQGFKYSWASWFELRYTEVMLNYAEIACGAGHMEVAVEQLQKIRKVAGYNETAKDKEIALGINYTNWGLPTGIEGDAAACMAAVLYERQIELAFEGKRFDDMRRWLLFDGGVNFQSIGAKALTGWGGNTCAYLGFEPFNGQRRSNMEFQVKPSVNGGLGGKEWKQDDWDGAPDPLLAQAFADQKISEKTWAAFKSWRDGMAIKPNSVDRHNKYTLDPALEKLRDEFYIPYLQRKEKKGDALTSDNTTEGMVVTFLPRYYFLGLTNGVQAKNPGLQQTVGWEDYYGGSNLFDPLAD